MSDLNPPSRGLVAGKYQIVGLIGRGGMGSVWEGRHSSLGTRVAIKFIDQEYAASEEACARFVAEARAAATIQSKHAIQIFDHGVTDDGRPYMVMELLTGEPLDKRIERLGTLPLLDTARIIGHVCRALQRAHDAGIIHRDLKPENVFLVRAPDDDDEIAKVLDFGIAKIKAPPGEAATEGLTSTTKTGAVLGTPYYMSPEQARGLRNIDHRSDLWSLGVIAYKCVTGVLPFEGESVGDLLVKICTVAPPRPSAMVPGLPASFDAWFARALEREPTKRFASATDLAESLALAAGLSLRGANSAPMGPDRGPSPVLSSSGPAFVATRSSASPLPAAGVTSSPFTAPVVSSRASRGVLFAVVAALLGGTIGVVAVIKLVSPRAIDARSTPAVSQPPVTGVIASSLVTGPPAPSLASPLASGTASAAGLPSTPAPTALRTAGALTTGLSSASPKGSSTSSAPGSGPRLRPALSVPQAKAPNIKPSPNLADPGY